jgi:hypothetical protein
MSDTLLVPDPIVTTEPYGLRPVVFLELWQRRGWRMKLYGISLPGTQVRPDLVEQAKALAAARLPLPAVTDEHYGVGYIIVHEGLVGDYVFVNWWWQQDILQQHQ